MTYLFYKFIIYARKVNQQSLYDMKSSLPGLTFQWKTHQPSHVYKKNFNNHGFFV